MHGIVPGLEFQQCGMRLWEDLGPGLFGRRWSVRLIHQQRGQPVWSRIAEVVDVRDTQTETRCDNISLLAGRDYARGLAPPIATEWIDDHCFAAIWDLTPNARTIASLVTHPDFTPPDEHEFWSVAAMLYRAVSQLHRAGVVHGAISPHAFYHNGDSFILGDFWWLCPFDGRAWKATGETPLRDCLPEAVRNFSAPEVRRGEQATQASDLYSLGTVLCLLLSKDANAVVEVSGSEAIECCDRSIAPETERGRFTMELLHDDPHQRLNRPLIETRLNEVLLSRVSSCFPKEWQIRLTNEFGVTLHGLAPDHSLQVFDLYQFSNTLQLGCRLEDEEAWFTIEGLLLTGGNTYLAIKECPEHHGRLDCTPMTVVRLEHDWQIRTIGANELLAVQEDLTENVYRGTSRDLTYAEFLLGPIREWEQPPDSLPWTLEPV